MLSARGQAWAKVGFLHGKEDSYDPEHNPNGIVMLTNAENWFVHQDMADFINAHNHFSPETCRYGEGYTGTIRLRTAMAKHLNEYFHPAQAIDPEEITFAAGVTDINEACSLITCNPNSEDAIMLGRPIYGPFTKDLMLRTSSKTEWVPVGDVDQFTPACATAFEEQYEAAKARGRDIKALIITNPHNPLGCCYPPETLKALLRFCSDKGLHLISDEIYAMSTYERDDRPSEKFTSVRAIDYSDIIDPRQVHVLYGMSKDYGLAGMRLGCLITQNTEFAKALRAICRFSSPSQFSMELAARFLEDRAFVKQFLEKSHSSLLRSRLLAEELLHKANIPYLDKGNAGLFLWVDLSSYLPLSETNGDGWAAEKLLSDRFKRSGVLMDTGREYDAEYPGRFRLMHTVWDDILREGIKRISDIISKRSVL